MIETVERLQTCIITKLGVRAALRKTEFGYTALIHGGWFWAIPNSEIQRRYTGHAVVVMLVQDGDFTLDGHEVDVIETHQKTLSEPDDLGLRSIILSYQLSVDGQMVVNWSHEVSYPTY
jgi:hypothetical protein